MAYDESTGVLTIDSANETFDEILDNTARALNDYRVTEVAGVLARDVGLLCTSPNVNRNSVRRPIYTPIDKLGMDTEAYLQSQLYGFKDLFNNSKNYTKLGYGTTQSWFDNIAAKGAGADLWGDSLPNGGYYVINQFNKYYNKAESRNKGLIHSVKPVIEERHYHRQDYSATANFGSRYTLTNQIFDTGENYYAYGLCYAEVVFDIYFEEGGVVKFEGDLYIKDYIEDISVISNIHYFDIDNPSEGEVSYDRYGNKINFIESGHLQLTLYTSWATSYNGDQYPHNLVGELEVITQNTWDITGSSRLPLDVHWTSSTISYLANSSISDNKFIGITFSGVPEYLSFGYNNGIQLEGYKSPMDSIFASIDNGSDTAYGAGSILVAILAIKVGTNKPIYFIVNPYHKTYTESGGLASAWGGIVRYTYLGFTETEAKQIKSVYCLLCYIGTKMGNLLERGYDDISYADPHVLIPERFGYNLVMQA